MSNSTYRVALVGTGGISRSHAAACSLAERARLTAICDLSQASIDRFRKWFPEVRAAAYLDLDQMLAKEEIDIAIICTWGARHAEVGERLARSGRVRAILCEKPFTQTAREAQRLVAAAGDSGVVIVEAFKFRHHPMHLKARELIDAGTIGDPLTIQSTFGTGRASLVRKPESNWRFNRQQGGGSIYDLGCYNIHHARWILGEEPEAVFASGRLGFEVDDRASIQLVFPSGAVAQIMVGFDVVHSQEFQIRGSSGTLRNDQAWNNTDLPVWLERESKGLTERFHFAPANSFKLQLEHLCEVLDGTAEPRIPAQNSIDQMKVIDAVYESIASRGVVAL